METITRYNAGHLGNNGKLYHKTQQTSLVTVIEIVELRYLSL